MTELKINGMQNIFGMKFHDIEGRFGDSKKAMQVKDIAEIHGRELKHINENINNYRKRFIDEVNIIDLLGVGMSDPEIIALGFTQQAINSYRGLKTKGLQSGIYILSERGYAKLLKILEDDVAWEQYEKLVGGYFNMRAKAKAVARTESLYNVSLTSKQISALYEAAGMKPQYILLAVKQIYRKADIDLPVLELKTEKELFNKEDIANLLGVLSKNGNPHPQAIGAVINQLDIDESEKELISFEKNGHVDTDYNYTKSAVDKVELWLQLNRYPSVIAGPKQRHKVIYNQSVAQ